MAAKSADADETVSVDGLSFEGNARIFMLAAALVIDRRHRKH